VIRGTVTITRLQSRKVGLFIENISISTSGWVCFDSGREIEDLMEAGGTNLLSRLIEQQTQTPNHKLVLVTPISQQKQCGRNQYFITVLRKQKHGLVWLSIAR
jgi:hypothetical protein